MPSKRLTPLNLDKNELRNAVIQNLSASPSSPVAGQLYYDTDDNILYFWNGTAWTAASGSSGGPPTGSAGGDLTGTYPNPTLSATKDANVKARANHTGTQAASTISDFDTQVRTSRLDQMAAPTADVSLNSRKITSLTDPTAAQDAATKAYVDATAQGLAPKDSVRAATTANITLSAPQTIDTVAVIAGDRVLVKNQSTPAQNGIYVVAAGAWTRSGDMDSAAEVDGAFTIVEDGAQAGTLWVTTSEVTTLGTDAIAWTQFNSAADITAGTGLTKSGNQLSLTSPVTVALGGTGQTAAKAARETGLGAAGYYSSATHGAGTSISIPQATHGLRASRGLIVQIQEEASGDVWEADVSVASSGDVTVTFAASQGANTIRVTIVG